VKIITAILTIWCSVVASAQVKISVPELAYKPHDRIDVVIMNAGATDISFCVEYGYVSYIDSDHPKPTPTPVHVQQKNSRGWGTLMTGPDIGSSRNSFTLGHGKSQHFPFRVNAHGTVRLVLDYWLDSAADPCQSGKGMKSVRSREFSIE
jgi:hypothetical protein